MKTRAPILATRGGPSLLASLLVHIGAACSTCGYGTRATSKRWAKCRRCGAKVERRPLPSRTKKQVRRRAPAAE